MSEMLIVSDVADRFVLRANTAHSGSGLYLTGGRYAPSQAAILTDLGSRPQFCDCLQVGHSAFWWAL